MINAELRKLAEEYRMKVDQGVAYGILEGYAATFLDGTGCSRLMLTTRFDSPAQKDALMDIVNVQDLKNTYGIRKLQIAKKVIHVAFRSQPDQITKIRAFIGWFFPLLEQFGASKAHICTQCQEPIAEEDAHWVLRDGATAFRMHKSCAEELKESISSDKKNNQASANGSVSKGLCGALLGALLGVLLWIVLQQINFFSPIAGLATGWLVVYFYGKFQGRSGNVRLLILIVSTLLATVLGVFLANACILIRVNGFALFLEAFQGSTEFRAQLLDNLPSGLFFMALGLFVSLKSEGRRTNVMVVTDLE